MLVFLLCVIRTLPPRGWFKGGLGEQVEWLPEKVKTKFAILLSNFEKKKKQL